MHRVYEVTASATNAIDSSDHTLAIQAMIDDCGAAGGGVVRVLAGVYVCTTLRLRSNVTLQLDEGARIAGSTDVDAYSAPTANNNRWNRALVLIENATDVAIVGPGTLDGRHAFDPHGEERMRGPHTVVTLNARRVRVENMKFVDSANYAILAYQTNELTVRNCVFTGGWDGVHIRGTASERCKQITITNCEFYTGDDSIAGWYWDDFVISGCIINSSCNGIRVIGPATGLTIHDTLFFGPGRHPHRTSGALHRTNMLAGILIQPGAWDPTQGHSDNIVISHVVMRDVKTAVAVFNKPGNSVGTILIEHLSAHNVYGGPCAFESWSDNPIERIVMRDSYISFTQQATVTTPTDYVHNEPRHETRDMPGWALFAHRIGAVELHHVCMTTPHGECRPDIVGDNVRHTDSHFDVATHRAGG